MPTWGEDQRVGLAVHHAYTHAKERLREVKGDDRLALHKEYLEWFLAVDTDEDDTEIEWCDHYKAW